MRSKCGTSNTSYIEATARAVPTSKQDRNTKITKARKEHQGAAELKHTHRLQADRLAPQAVPHHPKAFLRPGPNGLGALASSWCSWCYILP